MTRGLQGKVTLLVAITAVVSLLVFCAIAYGGIYLEEDLDIDVIPEADDEASQFLMLAFGVAAPISLVITLGVARILVRRTLAPLDAVIRAAGEMTVDQLGRRLAAPAQRDELARLVETLNGLFARLELGFQGLHTFAADVSHELRTPLAVIINELEVVARRPRTDDEWREAVGRALGSMRRLVELVESMLGLARGGIAGMREHVDLVELVDESVNTFSARAEEAGVALAHVSTEAAATTANQAALGTALSALVANALRYTPRGGRVEVSVESGARIHVDDSGSGVAPAEREQIFRPLVRGSAGRDADGFGLGLAIVKRVMDAHAGAVEVATSPLGGARFTLSVPPS